MNIIIQKLKLKSSLCLTESAQKYKKLNSLHTLNLEKINKTVFFVIYSPTDSPLIETEIA